MEAHETANPVEVALLGPAAVVASSHCQAHNVQQFGFGRTSQNQLHGICRHAGYPGEEVNPVATLEQ